MPIRDDNQVQDRLSQQPAEQLAEQQATNEQNQPGFFETLGAAFKTDNTVFNVVRGVMEPDLDGGRLNPDFDPFANIQGYEEYASNFVEANSDRDVELIKQRVEFENEQRRIIAQSPGWAQATSLIAANVIDPLALVPIMKGLPVASRLGRTLSGAAQGTAFGVAAGTAREGILQSVQETRTTEESMVNILAEGAFGGILGGAAGALTSPARAASKSILAKAMQGKDYKVNISEDGVPTVERSAGAAEVIGREEAEGIAHLNEQLVKIMSGPEFLQSPVIRGLTSKSATVRAFTNRSFLHNFIIGRNTEGVSTVNVAEKMINRDIAEFARANNTVKNLYLKHTGVGTIKSTVARPAGKLNLIQFNERISKALRDESYIDEIPEVMEASKIYRAQIQKYQKQLQELKLLPEDLDQELARNYLTRIYDLKKLEDPNVRQGFIDTVSEHIRLHDKDGALRATPLDIDTAIQKAEESLAKIRGESDEQIALAGLTENMVSKGKFLKTRTLNIPDAKLEPFLVNDAEQILNNYVHRASALIHTQRSLNELGFENMSQMKSAIVAERDKALEGITDAKQASKIEREFKKAADVADLSYRAMTSTLRKPGSADRFFETLRNYQFVRLLGGVTVSSIPELAMAPFRLGFLNTLRDGYLPMLRSFKTAKMAKDQLKDLDIGIELEMNNVLKAMADNDVELGRGHNTYDRMMGAVSDAFGKASGISYYTNMGRRIAGQTAMSDIIRTMKEFEKTGALPQKKIEELASIGLDKFDYQKVIDQINKHVEQKSGSFISNINLWDDPLAAKAFKDAVQTQVESVILKPGRGDIPFAVQQSQLGRLVFQFKSFMSTATGRITLSGLQRRDARALSGMMALIALGSLSGVVKDKIAGRESDTSPDALLLDGISRSGVAGLIGTTALDIGLNLTNEKTRRFGGNIASAITGPTISQLFETEKVIGRFADGKVTEKDLDSLQRMLPFQNLFYINILMDKAFGNNEDKN